MQQRECRALYRSTTNGLEKRRRRCWIFDFHLLLNIIHLPSWHNKIQVCIHLHMVFQTAGPNNIQQTFTMPLYVFILELSSTYNIHSQQHANISIVFTRVIIIVIMETQLWFWSILADHHMWLPHKHSKCHFIPARRGFYNHSVP